MHDRKIEKLLNEIADLESKNAKTEAGNEKLRNEIEKLSQKYFDHLDRIEDQQRAAEGFEIL